MKTPCILTGVFVLLALGACSSSDPAVPLTAPPVATSVAAPSYREVAERYNRNIQRIERLWARSVVELRWRAKDRKRFEQGDGHLILILPDRLAFSVGKLGEPLLWVGSDSQRYWFIDRTDADEKVAFVGRHDRTVRGGPRNSPLPFRPLDLPHLLGLVPLDPDPGSTGSPVVESYDGQWLVEPPGNEVRMLLDPQTALPVRVDLLDSQGYSTVIAHLERPALLTLENLPPGAYPRIATRAEVRIPGSEGHMTLFLSDPTDEERKFKPEAFDFEHLTEVLGPLTVEDLDR